MQQPSGERGAAMVWMVVAHLGLGGAAAMEGVVVAQPSLGEGVRLGLGFRGGASRATWGGLLGMPHPPCPSIYRWRGEP